MTSRKIVLLDGRRFNLISLHADRLWPQHTSARTVSFSVYALLNLVTLEENIKHMTLSEEMQL